MSSGWLAAWTERGVRARYCTDDPAVPGTLLVWLDPATLMGLGNDHRSVVAAPRLYGRERRTLHWLDSGVAQGGDGRASVVLPSCMTAGLPSARAALAGAVADPWVVTSPRLSWERRDAACPAGTHRPSTLPASEPARVERRRVTKRFNRKGVEVPPPAFGPWEIAVDLCERDFTITETETQSCTYTIEGQSAVGYKIVTRQKTVTAGGDSYSPWVELFSTCWTGTVATIPPPTGTPETLPQPTITFPTWTETEPESCPVCFDGSAFRWRRHTDRHVRFPWDSQPTVQTDVNVTNWVTDRSGCTPTPPTVLGTSTSQATRTGGCAAGETGSVSESRTETWRREIPCGGSERRVLESATAWSVDSNTCVAVPDDDPDPDGEPDGDPDGDPDPKDPDPCQDCDGGPDGGDEGEGTEGEGSNEGTGNNGYGDVGLSNGVDDANAHDGSQTDHGQEDGGSGDSEGGKR